VEISGADQVLGRAKLTDRALAGLRAGQQAARLSTVAGTNNGRAPNACLFVSEHLHCPDARSGQRVQERTAADEQMP
jgi:hypothetical protein